MKALYAIKQVISKLKNTVSILLLLVVLVNSIAYGQFDRSHEAIVVSSGDLACLLNRDIPDLVGFSFDGTQWNQIPIQIDERAMLDYSVPYNLPGSTGVETLFYTDANTHTGADPNPLLDDNDELVFMYKDLGERAMGMSNPPGTIQNTDCLIAILDPIMGDTSFLYIYDQDGSLSQDAGVDYVHYEFDLLSGPYLSTYDMVQGPNPENSIISSDYYIHHFSDRWIYDEMYLIEGTDTTPDLLDRHKNLTYPGFCGRSEDTFSEGGGCIISNVDGAIRAIRAYMGSNSGIYTNRTNYYYEKTQFVVTNLRVHPIPAMFDFYDFSPAASGSSYFNSYNEFHTIDGIPEMANQNLQEWEVINFPQNQAIFVDYNLEGTWQEGADGSLGRHWEDNAMNPIDTCTGDDFSYGASGGYVIFDPEICTDNIAALCPAGTFRTFSPRRHVLYGQTNINIQEAVRLDSVFDNPLIIVDFDCMASFAQIMVEDCDEYRSPSGKIFDQTGQYVDTIFNRSGCDSIIAIDLTIKNSQFSMISASECDEYRSPSGKIFDQSGHYQDTITASNLCDSIITINLTIVGSPTSSISPIACNSYQSPAGNTYTQTGVYMDTIPSSQMCDSIITIDLTIVRNQRSSISPTACNSYQSPAGNTYTQTGVYVDTIPSSQMCDSIITIDLTIVRDQRSSISPTACNSYQSPAGNTYTQTGIYVDTIPSSQMCDSIITIDLTIVQEKRSSINPTACNSYRSPAGNTYTQTGVYMDTIPSSDMCDSIITIDLTIVREQRSSISPTACNTYQSPAGNTYTQTGIYVDTIPSSQMCDSIITIDLTIVREQRSSISPTACNTYQSPAGNTYTQTGVYVDTIPSSQMCDSIITIDLTIVREQRSSISPTACNTYQSPAGNTYTQTGVYVDTIPSSQMCDSIITIDLTIVREQRSSISPTSCNTYRSPAGNTYTQTGVYVDTIPSSQMCDSIITIDLTIVREQRSSISPTSCNTYRSPAGNTYTQTGVYVDTIPSSQMCDSIITIDLTIVREQRSMISPTACDSYQSPAGNTYTQTGVYVDTIPSSQMCDSIITIDLTIAREQRSMISPLACDSYLSPAGNTYTQTGVYVDTIPSSQMCDSIITIDLTVVRFNVQLNLDGQELSIEDYPGASYTWIDCNSGAELQLGTDNTFMPSYTGDFKVKVEFGDCADSSSCVNVIINNTNNFNSEGLLIFPNPFREYLIVQQSNRVFSYEVLDVWGRVIYSGKAQRLETRNWPEGIYFIRFENDQIQKILKL